MKFPWLAEPEIDAVESELLRQLNEPADDEHFSQALLDRVRAVLPLLTSSWSLSSDRILSAYWDDETEQASVMATFRDLNANVKLDFRLHEDSLLMRRFVVRRGELVNHVDSWRRIG